MHKRILVWFRNDLRLHDNEMLVEAIAKSDQILPVYIFDPRHFESTSLQTVKTGVARAKFIIESVAELQQSFQQLGGNLLVLAGLPEQVIPQLVTAYQINEVYHHREVASEETAISTAVEDALWKLKVNLKHFIGHTLYNKEDLPFPIKDIPDVFTQFKKKTERDAVVKPCVDTPKSINFVEFDTESKLPKLADLFLAEVFLADSFDHIKGGENQALAHLSDFLAIVDQTVVSGASLKKIDLFSKLSGWLSLGCLSPRYVYWKMKGLEQNIALKPIFNHIIVGLLWRDYYRFMFKKHGNKFFTAKGFSSEVVQSTLIDQMALDHWKAGETEMPLVNAIMHELNSTGYINNSARQLVAAYLVHELHVSWVFGAAYFEEKLVDYCPASNWGNWANIAGVGNDQRASLSSDFEKILKNFEHKAPLTAH